MRGRRSIARILGGVLWAVVALFAAVLLLALGLPLAVRGPLLGGMVERAARDRCGSVKLEGGAISLDVVPALIFQRPFEVELARPDIREPNGNQLFHARVVRVKMAVLRRPWRVVIDRMLVADGALRLVDEGAGLPITQALAKVPPGGLQKCGQPEPPAAAGAPPPPQGSLLTVRTAVLENVSLILSFPPWGVTLDSIDAHGTLDIRAAAEGTQVLFDVRDLRAKDGGSLRVGEAGAPLTPEIPFDRIVIPRVAVTSSAPYNLRLQVAEARTGDAVLSGRAVFMNIFAPSERHLTSGMDVDARWPHVGHALARSSPWAAVGERLAWLDAGLRASLHGPFDALTGPVALAGKGVSAQARLLPRQRYALNVDFADLDTSPLLPPARRASLGGRLNGRISLSARLGDSAADTTVSLDAIELALLRSRADSADGLPRRLVLSRDVRRNSPGELRIALGVVAFNRETLRVDPFRVEGPVVALAGRLRGEREPRSGAFRLHLWTQPGSRVTWGGETFLPPPFFAARITPGPGVAIEPFSIRHVGGGAIDAGGSARLDGPSNLWTAIRGYPLAHIPGLAGVRVPGWRATVAQLLRGRLNASFRLGGRARRRSLSGVLALSDVRWAGHAAGNGRVVFQGARDGTRFDGQLIDGVGVQGDLRRQPRADDFVTVTLRDLRLGPWLPAVAAALAVRASGQIVWRPGGRGSRASASADLALRGPGIELKATARVDPARRVARLKGRLALAGMRAALPALHLRQAAGVINLDVSLAESLDDDDSGSQTPRLDGAIAIAERVALWRAGWPAAIIVPPSRVELRGDDVRVPSLAVLTSGARGTLTGALHLDWTAPSASRLAGSFRIRVEGRGIGPWLPGRPGGGSGWASFGGQLAGSIGAPHVQGQARFQGLTLDWPDSPVGAVRLDGPLAIDGRTLAVGPLVARFQSGGWLKVAGAHGSGRLVVGSRRAPLPMSDVDLTVLGSGLATLRPISGLTVRDLALGVRLTEVNQKTVRVVGEVNVGHDLFELAQRPKSTPAAKSARRPPFVDHVWVRLRLVGPDDAMTVGVPYAPNVTVGARCVIEGPLTSPHLTGEVTGDGLYSRAALAVADWFTPRNLRKCDLLPR